MCSRSGFDSLQRSPRTRKGTVNLGEPRSLLHSAIILLHDVVQVFALAQMSPAPQGAFRLQLFHGRRIRRVLVHVDDTWMRVSDCPQSLAEEAFGACCVSFGREQENDGLSRRIPCPIVDRSGKQGYVVHTHWGIVENDKLQRIWGSGRDVTEFRSIEAQFRHAQRLDSIGRLTAGVAHDFDKLLTVIQGYSVQLLENMNQADAAYMGLKEIRKAAEKGAALTNQMLTFSRKQELDLRPLNLNTLVAEDEEILRRVTGKNIELTISLEPSLGLVRANSGSIHQVLLNLAINARDAMPSGGRLHITLSNVDVGEPRPPQLATVPCGPYVRLSVSDSGVGMSADVVAHLFEPFFMTKKETEGTGLGLSTVYGIVRQSGGYINVDSELGRGTTFEIFLPRESSQPSAVSGTHR
jgi:signal transduction histidine kinase